MGRLLHEIKTLDASPPWGIVCKPETEDVLDVLRVKMLGPLGSPYEAGMFELVVNIPDRYPFQPPQVKFVTPVYHPNIDKGLFALYINNLFFFYTHIRSGNLLELVLCSA